MLPDSRKLALLFSIYFFTDKYNSVNVYTVFICDYGCKYDTTKHVYMCSLSVYVFCFLMCLCTGLHVYAMDILIPISVMINWHSGGLWPSGITPFVCLDFLCLVLFVVFCLFVCILCTIFNLESPCQ